MSGTSPLLTFDQALSINSRIAKRYFLANGLTDNPVLPSLNDVSLAEMLTAVQMVREHNENSKPVNGTRHLHVVPDDRLVAAVYVAIHYSVDAEQPIVIEPEKDEDGRWVMKALAIVDVTDRAELRGVEAA
ncbi:hypothetical protein ASC97_05810 [Rhizobium sp. Root1203]|uniref:hypothetical protein n=1 Tax=Rhizobium sp. Root1203 TaxID=1736427 RepID=UPI00070DD4B1|nr:hypothetical protein [Rhizobium sp. Root1203]KQV27877.1 hypothetical protein ASC97_05810 [Rhizobium sp. Root1203]